MQMNKSPKKLMDVGPKMFTIPQGCASAAEPDEAKNAHQNLSYLSRNGSMASIPPFDDMEQLKDVTKAKRLEATPKEQAAIKSPQIDMSHDKLQQIQQIQIVGHQLKKTGEEGLMDDLPPAGTPGLANESGMDRGSKDEAGPGDNNSQFSSLISSPLGEHRTQTVTQDLLDQKSGKRSYDKTRQNSQIYHTFNKKKRETPEEGLSGKESTIYHNRHGSNAEIKNNSSVLPDPTSPVIQSQQVNVPKGMESSATEQRLDYQGQFVKGNGPPPPTKQSLQSAEQNEYGFQYDATDNVDNITTTMNQAYEQLDDMNELVKKPPRVNLQDEHGHLSQPSSVPEHTPLELIQSNTPSESPQVLSSQTALPQMIHSNTQPELETKTMSQALMTGKMLPGKMNFPMGKQKKQGNQAVTSQALRDNQLHVFNLFKQGNVSNPTSLQDADFTHSKTASISQFLSNDVSLSLTPSLDPTSHGNEKDPTKLGPNDSQSQWKFKQNLMFFSGGFKKTADRNKRKHSLPFSQISMNKDVSPPLHFSPIMETSEQRKTNHDLQPVTNLLKPNHYRTKTFDKSQPTLKTDFSDPQLQDVLDNPTLYIPKTSFKSRPIKRIQGSNRKFQFAPDPHEQQLKKLVEYSADQQLETVNELETGVGVGRGGRANQTTSPIPIPTEPESLYSMDLQHNQHSAGTTSRDPRNLKEAGPGSADQQSEITMVDLIKREAQTHIASFYTENLNENSGRKKPMYNLSTAGKSYRYLKDIKEVKEWEQKFQSRKLSMFAARARDHIKSDSNIITLTQDDALDPLSIRQKLKKLSKVSEISGQLRSVFSPPTTSYASLGAPTHDGMASNGTVSLPVLSPLQMASRSMNAGQVNYVVVENRGAVQEKDQNQIEQPEVIGHKPFLEKLPNFRFATMANATPRELVDGLMIDSLIKNSPRRQLKQQREIEAKMITPMNKYEAILFRDKKNGKNHHQSLREVPRKSPQELMSEASMPFQNATFDIIPEVSSDLFSHQNQPSQENTSGEIDLNKTLNMLTDDSIPHQQVVATLERQKEMVNLREIESSQTNGRDNSQYLPSGESNLTNLKEGEIENNSSLILKGLQNLLKHNKRDNSEAVNIPQDLTKIPVINSSKNIQRKPFMGANNPIQLVNSELHVREKQLQEQQQRPHDQMAVTKNSIVNIGSTVLMEYEDNQNSSGIQFEGKVTSFDDNMRENFKFSPPQDGNHPVLHLVSDLTTIKEPGSFGCRDINRDSPRFNTGPNSKEVNFNFNSQTTLRQNGLQNLDEFSKNKTFQIKPPIEGQFIQSEIEVESQEFIANIDQQSITLQENSHDHDQDNFTPFPIETSINDQNNSPFLTEHNITPFTEDQNFNPTPFPTDNQKSMASFPIDFNTTQNKMLRDLGVPQTRLQTLNNSLQDLEVARSSQLDVGQYQTLIQSIVCSASFLNKNKLAALEHQKRQQSHMRKKIKKDVEKFKEFEKRKLPQLLGQTKSHAQMEHIPESMCSITSNEISIHDHGDSQPLDPDGQKENDLAHFKQQTFGVQANASDNDLAHKRYNKKHQTIDITPTEVALSKQFEANFSLKTSKNSHNMNDPIKLGDIAKKRRKALIELSKQQKKKARKFSLKVPEHDPNTLLTLKNKIKLVRANFEQEDE